MLFRTSEGELVEIKKYDFSNDKIYYEKIMKIVNKSSKTNYNTLKNKNDKQPNKKSKYVAE
jgi:hypothetical protein